MKQNPYDDATLKIKLLEKIQDPFNINSKTIFPKGYVPYSQAIKREYSMGGSSHFRDPTDLANEVQKFLKEAFEQGLQVEALQETLDLYMGLKSQLQISQIQNKQANKYKSMDQLEYKIKGLNVVRDREVIEQNIIQSENENNPKYNFINAPQNTQNQVNNRLNPWSSISPQKGTLQNYTLYFADSIKQQLLQIPGSTLEGFIQQFPPLDKEKNEFYNSQTISQQARNNTKINQIKQMSHRRQQQMIMQAQLNSQQSPLIVFQKPLNLQVFNDKKQQLSQQISMGNSSQQFTSQFDQRYNKQSNQSLQLTDDEFVIGKNQWAAQKQLKRIMQAERLRPKAKSPNPKVKVPKAKSPTQSTKSNEMKEKVLDSKPLTQTKFKLRAPQKNIQFDGIYYKDQKFPKEPVFQEKYAAMRHFSNILNIANSLFVSPPNNSSIQPYKAYIGKGNNGLLVRIVLKSRWWWSLVDSGEQDQANFVWTQLRKNNIIKNLKIKNLSELESQSPATGAMRRVTEQYKLNESSGDEEVRQKQRSLSSVMKDNLITPLQTPFTKKDDQLTIQWGRLLPPSDLDLIAKILNSTGRQSKILDYKKAQEIKLSNKLTNTTEPYLQKCHNHLENNFHLGNKKALFYNMRAYYESQSKNVFDYLPLTFHLKGGLDSPEYQTFKNAYANRQEEVLMNIANTDPKVKKKPIANIWIVKPGEFTNRGQGIRVCSELNEIDAIVGSKDTHTNGSLKTVILQQYMDRPLLYNKRKFDIRCYMLFTTINGYQKAYWYQEGYIRTSSFEFSIKNLSNKMVHLTNDAVQKKGENYGKFEKGNKVSYEEFSKFLESIGEKVDFQRDIYPQMKQSACDQVRAIYGKVDPDHREQSLELFGLDFMVDENFKVWLIEANTNPCLEVCCPLLSRLIPNLIENIIRIAVDPIFPPPHFYNPKKLSQENFLESNRFDLIFDEVDDGPQVLMNRGNIGTQDFDLIEEESEEDEETEEQ